MKKIILILLLVLPICVFASTNECYLVKESSENYVLKSNDIITINFDYNVEDININYASYELYYDSSIFEIINPSNELLNIHEYWTVNEYKSYSSLLMFTISGNTIIDNNIVSLSFKVKENVKNKYTSIELINGSIKGHSNINNETVNVECNKNILTYEINNTSTINNYDAKISYIGFIKDNLENIDFYFNPLSFVNNLYITDNEYNIITNCASDNCNINVEGNINNNIVIKSSLNENINTYNINVINISDEKNDIYNYFLTSLSVLDYDLLEKFNKYRNTYHVIVKNDVESILLNYETQNNNRVKITYPKEYEVGKNTIKIEVYSKYNDEYINTYYLIVNKSDIGEEVYMKDISINNVSNNILKRKVYILSIMILSIILIIALLIDINNTKKLIKLKKRKNKS